MDYEVRSKGKIKPRRRYAPEFTQKVLRECDEGKESVTAISLKYGLNHNLVHKWRYLQRQSGGSKFVQLPMPKPALPVIAGEYATIERDASELSPNARYEIRQTRAKPILEALHQWLLSEREGLPDSVRSARAIDYTLKCWLALKRYLDDGSSPIDNNWVENQIRPCAPGPKNWLFAGSLRIG